MNDLKPVIESCWGCGTDYLHSWTKFDLGHITSFVTGKFDLGHITSFVTGNSDVLVCPDCREDISNIEKENTDEI